MNQLTLEQNALLDAFFPVEQKRAPIEKCVKMAQTFANMAKTYEQDGKGLNAMAYLHYHTPDNANHWFITEKDMDVEQYQAFGLVELAVGYGAELGYISLIELQNTSPIVIDLDFEPKTLEKVIAEYNLDY